MRVLEVLFLLAVSMALSSCDHSYSEKSFKSGVYISMAMDTYLPVEAVTKIFLYGLGANDHNKSVIMGPIIIQLEQKCPYNWTKRKFVFSRALLNIDPLAPPSPKDKSLKLDFQLGTETNFFAQKINNVIKLENLDIVSAYFAAQLEHDGKSIQTNWYYLAASGSEIWFQQMTGYFKKRKSCRPDDSNIQQLCGPNSGYTCPNTTYSEMKNVQTRNMNMYIVTGKAQTYEEHNCSYNYAVYDQYLKNHNYFMGNNSRNLKMKRTVPVMIKTILVYNPTVPCGQTYQMQFFVSSKALGGVVPPCPTNPAVMLQKINMEVYVKDYYGKANGPMFQLKNLFEQELTAKSLPYRSDQHFRAIFSGHGPVLGQRLEIWILKTRPTITFVC